MANQFLVSVANAYGKDANTGQAILMAKANISSAFTLSTTAQEVRGGIGNPLLYVFYHSRKVEIKLEAATYDKQFLGLNAGSLNQNGSITAVKNECITLSNGIGTCTQLPLSDIGVFLPDGTIQTVTPSGYTFTVVGGASLSVDVAYNYSVTADQITVSTSTPPSVIDLTLLAEVRDNTNVVTNYLQINIPKFQISGNYTLSFAANGVASNAIEGMALATTSTDCTTGDYFAKVTYIPAVAATVATGSIVAIPSTLTFPVSASTTKSVSVLAIKGTSTANITTSCSFTTGTAGSAFIIGLHTGIVTLSGSSATAGRSASMVVTYWDTVSSASLTDWVNLTTV
jgi:hypothetical protein